jgi:hypothetical protein
MMWRWMWGKWSWPAHFKKDANTTSSSGSSPSPRAEGESTPLTRHILPKRHRLRPQGRYDLIKKSRSIYVRLRRAAENALKKNGRWMWTKGRETYTL